MIADLLDAYQESRGENRQYTTLRSTVIDGHEVAWMEVNYGKDGDGMRLSRSLYCECDFDLVKHQDTRRCRYRRAAIHLWQLALRDEYIAQYAHEQRGALQSLSDHFSDIVLDLMQRRREGEFVDDTPWAPLLYGGLFYRQCLEVITESDGIYVHLAVQRMERDKQISMNGAVVQPYHKYSPTSKLEEQIVTPDGWKGQLHFCTVWSEGELHRWRFQVIRPDGSKVFKPAPTAVPDHEYDDSPEMKILLREHLIYAKHQAEET